MRRSKRLAALSGVSTCSNNTITIYSHGYNLRKRENQDYTKFFYDTSDSDEYYLFDRDFVEFTDDIDESHSDVDDIMDDLENIDDSGLVHRKVSIEEKDWLPATSIFNGMMKDWIVDWLNLYGEKEEIPGSYNEEDSFSRYLKLRGIEFESKVVEYLKHKYEDDFVALESSYNKALMEDYYTRTMEEMEKGTPIIYSGTVINYENGTWGIPDLIVRMDYLRTLTEEDMLVLLDEYVQKKYHDKYRGKAPKDKIKKKFSLDETSKSQRSGKYIYCIVDIKSKTLSFRANGIHLLNSGTLKPNKGQLYIYNEALAQMQGYNPGMAFLLGEGSKFARKGLHFKVLDSLYRLGLVDFVWEDRERVKETEETLLWLRDLRKNGHLWDPYNLERFELCPNMCNFYDGRWRKTKQRISEETGEITSMWMCGATQRRLAWDKGIRSIKDPNFDSYAVGFKGRKAMIIDGMIQIEKDEEPFYSCLKEDQVFIPEKASFEFFVDFEIQSKLLDDYRDIRNCNGRAYMTMIGVGYVKNEKWRYKCFTIDTVNLINERLLLEDFVNHINKICGHSSSSSPVLYHWGNIEQSFWEKMLRRHEGLNCNFVWIDLLSIVKNNAFVFKGARNYSIKTVGKSLLESNLISTKWEENDSGLKAMMTFYRLNKEAQRMGCTVREMAEAEELIRYNKVDCRVLMEILTCLREN